MSLLLLYLMMEAVVVSDHDDTLRSQQSIRVGWHVQPAWKRASWCASVPHYCTLQFDIHSRAGTRVFVQGPALHCRG